MNKSLFLKIAIMVSCLGISYSCFFQKNAATFEGGSISLPELEESSHGELYQIKRKEYEVKMRVLQNLAIEKILEMEAQKKKSNKEALINHYIESNFTPPTEEMLRNFYETNKTSMNKPFSVMRDKLLERMVFITKQELRQKYLGDLTRKYKLKFEIKPPPTPFVDIDVTGEPFWGQEDVKVVVVEYSDFECPYCQSMQPHIRRIRGEYEDKIKWVFKDFPLSFHRQALKAHIAANCAGQQNRYFDFQYKVFDAKSDISLPRLFSIAKNIGLDMDRFKTCIQDPEGKINKEISEDIKGGAQAGVGGTPTIFINGKVASNFRTYESMKKTLDHELAQSSSF